MYKKLLLTTLLFCSISMAWAGGKLTLREAIENAAQNGKKTAVIIDPKGVIRAKIESQEAIAQYLTCDAKNERLGPVPKGYFEIANIVAEQLKTGFENDNIELVDRLSVPYKSDDVEKWKATDYEVVLLVEVSVLYVQELSEKHRATKLEIEARLRAKAIINGKMTTLISSGDLGNTESEYFKHPDCYDKMNQYEHFITKPDILIDASKETTKNKLVKLVAKQNKKYAKAKK